MKKLMTLNDLYNFYSHMNQDCMFNAKQAKQPIYVQLESDLTFLDDYNPDDFKSKVHLRACHILRNRNGSSITEDAMQQAIPSIYDAPILGYIHQLSDGSYDFAGHEIEIVNGEYEYKEAPVGHVYGSEKCNPQLIYDKKKDKTYLEVDGTIYNEYSKAKEILQKKGVSKVSIEIAIDDLSYSATEKLLVINKFHFMGVTILGVTDDEDERPIGEGMEGANIKLSDFSESILDSEKLIQAIKELESSLEAYKKNFSNTIGGAHKMDKLNELLQKYEKTIEELPFASEVEGMTPEELEVKFAELFDSEEPDADPEKTKTKTVEEIQVDPVQEGSGNQESQIKPETFNDGQEKKKNCSITINEVTREFELSLNDKINALSTLVNDTYSESDNAWYCVHVYEDYVVMEDFWTGVAYKQKYTEANNVFSLEGDRVEVFTNWLTKEEMDELDRMRSSYFDMIRKQHEKEINEVLEDEAYADITDMEEFAELQKKAFDLSAEEVTLEADALLGRFCKQKKTLGKVGFNGAAKPSRKTPYGSLF